MEAPIVSEGDDKSPFNQGVFMPPDSAWLAVEPLGDEDLLRWPGSLDLVKPGNNDADASEMSRATSPSLLPAPVLLPVAPIADDHVDQLFEMPLPAFAAATLSCHSASKEKRLRPKELTKKLRSWMERHHKPYANLDEKKMIAEALSIPVAQVTNFCNNYRKRFSKVGDKLTSYRVLVSTAQ